MSGSDGFDFNLVTELEQKLASGSSKFSDSTQKQDLISAEIKGVARHLNNELANDPLARCYLPIQVNHVDLLDKVSDGVLHCAFVRCLSPESIAVDKIVTLHAKGRPLNRFEMQANQRLYIEAVLGLGLVVVNIGVNDLIDSRDHVSLVLGLLWQLLDRQVRLRTGLQRSPRLKPSIDEHKQLVLEWVNSRLSLDGSDVAVMRNFTTDVMDGRLYLALLRAICPSSVKISKPDHFNDDLSRAQAVISTSLKMGLRPLLDQHDIVSGHEQLNYVFIQSLIAWSRMREEALSQNQGIEAALEAQAPISVGRAAVGVLLIGSGPAQLMFYLGMKQNVTQLVNMSGRLPLNLLQHAVLPSAAPIRLRIGKQSCSIWGWALFQLHGRERAGTGPSVSSSSSSSISSSSPSGRTGHWSVSLLPGLESLGPLIMYTHGLDSSAIPSEPSSRPMISALFATALGRTLVAPLETLQIRAQVHHLWQSNSVQGVMASDLFRGHSANLVRLIPYTAIQFLACNHEELGRGQYASLIAATGLATLATYPLDMVQTQMAVSRYPHTGGGSGLGLLSHIWNSVRVHGPTSGLFRGALVHGMGALSFVSMHVISEPHLNGLLGSELGGLMSFTSCLVATYPARTISRQMQIGLMQRRALPPASRVIYDTVQRHGLQGLYRGLVPALIKTAPLYLGTRAIFHWMQRYRRD